MPRLAILTASFFVLTFFLFLKTQGLFIKMRALHLAGPFANEIDYFPAKAFKERSDIFAKDVFAFAKNDPLEREILDPTYAKAKHRYLAYGMKNILKFDRRTSSPTLSPRLFSTDDKESKPLLYVGLIVFKRGEMRQTCLRTVNFARTNGFSGIAFFLPVHFSGGNGKNYSMPKTPTLNKHYKYEMANSPSTIEIDHCLKNIELSGLKLNYIPHLENISTLNLKGSKDWRLLSGIPINNTYREFAFAPLLNFLKKNPKAFSDGKNLTITFAAELDPLVFARAGESIEQLNKLENNLRTIGLSQFQFALNTNGDFLHGWDQPQVSRKWDCTALKKMLQKISILSPSMYGEHGHLAFNSSNKLDISLTVSRFRDRLLKKVKAHCDNLDEELTNIPMGFGEFAIDATNPLHNYTDILSSAEHEVQFVHFWNHGQWDHLGVNTAGNDKLKEQIFEFLRAPLW